MKEVDTFEFKARCLQLIDEVAETQKSLVVTKDGEPVCRIIPYKPKPKTLFGTSRDTVMIEGDIVSPIDVEWDAAQ